MKIRYNPGLTQRARALRKQGVLSEALLWNQLKGRKMCGYQFMRQKPIGEYVVDFYCSRLQLVIDNPLTPFVKGEDGESHRDRGDYDRGRQQFLESLGLTVLRFHDTDVKRNMDSVLMVIDGWVANRGKQPPLPPFIKGE